MPEWQEVARFEDLAAFGSAAEALDAQHFGSGERGLVAVRLPFAPDAGFLDNAQAVLQAGGVHLWQPVAADGNTLLVYFERRSPGVLAVALALLPWLAVMVVVGAIAVLVYKFVQAAGELSGSFGTLVAAGAALVLLPNILARSTGAVRNPIDSAGLAQLAGLGVLGAITYSAAKAGTLPASLQQIAHDLSPGTFPAPAGSGATARRPHPALPPPPGTQPGSQPAPQACFRVADGNTRLSFEVQPPNPFRAVGEPVSYVGQLTSAGAFGRWSPLPGKTIEFWASQDCAAGPYDWATTDERGAYSVTRPLASDELDGYMVFAFFRGEAAFIGQLDPAITGVWGVVPQ